MERLIQGVIKNLRRTFWVIPMAHLIQNPVLQVANQMPEGIPQAGLSTRALFPPTVSSKWYSETWLTLAVEAENSHHASQSSIAFLSMKTSFIHVPFFVRCITWAVATHEQQTWPPQSHVAWPSTFVQKHPRYRLRSVTFREWWHPKGMFFD